jgi:hypothetical protein
LLVKNTGGDRAKKKVVKEGKEGGRDRGAEEIRKGWRVEGRRKGRRKEW